MANPVTCLNFNKLLGKNLIRKYPHNFFFTWIIFITHGEWNINILWTNQHRISHSGIFLPFWANLVQKTKIVYLRWNLLSTLNRISENTMVMFPFCSILDREYRFLPNLFTKFKIICLMWNLVPRLIRINKIQEWYSPFLF